tara:strand:- start:112 stop:417 length:306 start_codon:yes stop_codon:yes gene_type:complete
MPNNELDYQVLLGTYQRKSADLLAQVIALEARVSSNNNTIDALNKQVTDLLKELEHAKEVVVQLKRAELERAEKEENLDTVPKTKQKTKSKTINSVDEGDF